MQARQPGQLDLPTPVRLEDGGELAFARAVVEGFHEDEADESLGPWADALGGDDHRCWIVRDRGSIVGTLGVLATDLSLPGAARIGNAAITAVTVAQTHRRRGILRSMLTVSLEEAATRGEQVATLYASEASIYPRFGFGPCSPTLRYRIDRGIRFHDAVDTSLVEPIRAQEALATFPAIFERARDQRAGVGLSPARWRLHLAVDPPSGRDGASALRFVTVPGRGYAAYRVKPGEDVEGLPTGTVRLRDLVATDPEAEAALWQHVCDVDLTTSVEVHLRPPDDALAAAVTEPTRLRAAVGSPLYSRLLDVGGALRARRYATTGRALFRVHDGLRDQSGTYRLDVTDDGVTCERAGEREPDLEFALVDLSTVWLGGVRTTQLLAGRRVVEHRPGAAAAFDRLLADERAPWTSFLF